MKISKPTFPEASLDRVWKAERSWETFSSLVLDFSLTAFTSHHLESLYSKPAECEVITVLVAGGKNYYNLCGKKDCEPIHTAKNP